MLCLYLPVSYTHLDVYKRQLRARAEMDSVSQLIQAIIDETGYVDELKAEGTDEAEQRIENIDCLLYTSFVQFIYHGQNHNRSSYSSDKRQSIL